MVVHLFLGIGEDLGSKWPLYALAAVTVAYVVFRPMLRKKKPDPLERMPSFGLAQQRAVEREMSNLLVELSQMTRQITAQLDTRAAKLEALIEEADRRIGELRKLEEEAAERRTDESTPRCSPEESGGEEEAGSAEVGDSQHEAVYAMADSGRSAQEIAGELGRPRGEIELILALRPRASGKGRG
ncbi:MAG: hypothetical protein ACM359_04085 [Bacillota bacterium]